MATPSRPAPCATPGQWSAELKQSACQYIAEALRLAWADLNGNGVVMEFRSIIRDIRAKKAAGTFTLGRQSAYRAAYYTASW